MCRACITVTWTAPRQIITRRRQRSSRRPEVILGIGMGSVTDWSKVFGRLFCVDVVIIPSAIFYQRHVDL